MIVWSDQFSVGVPQMDAQHRRMIDLINTLHSGADAGSASQAISGMFDYASQHFASEEELLRRVGYSELHTQQREHRAFLSKADEFSKANLNTPEMCAQIADFLRSWMLHHILEEDMKYKRCIPETFIRSP